MPRWYLFTIPDSLIVIYCFFLVKEKCNATLIKAPHRRGEKRIELTFLLEITAPFTRCEDKEYLLFTAFRFKVCANKSNLLSPSRDLGIGLVWDNHPPHRNTNFLVWLLKSSSNWTKLSMRGPQLFSGWYQMILDVFLCSQLFSNVFWRFFPTVEILLKLN